MTDTGIGIAPEDIENVMKPFGQARNSLEVAVSEPGTGLGLSLSRSFIEKHGGTLTLDSEPGAGTRVTITLPASRIMGGETEGNDVQAVF